MKNNVVGGKINALMTARNISIQELSERCGLTVSQIELIISSEKVPSLGALIKIAAGLV